MTTMPPKPAARPSLHQLQGSSNTDCVGTWRVLTLQVIATRCAPMQKERQNNEEWLVERPGLFACPFLLCTNVIASSELPPTLQLAFFTSHEIGGGKAMPCKIHSGTLSATYPLLTNQRNTLGRGQSGQHGR